MRELGRDVMVPQKCPSFKRKLPTEICFTVWSLLPPGPRIVEFEWSDDGGWFCPKESSTGRRSILLSINKESRKYFLKTYFPLARSKNACF
jgi:hypothetical protein